MRLLTFATRARPGIARVGAMLDDRVLDLQAAEAAWTATTGRPALVPPTMKGLLKLEEAGRERVAALLEFARSERSALPGALLAQSDIVFLPPGLLTETPMEPTGFSGSSGALPAHPIAKGVGASGASLRKGGLGGKPWVSL